MTNTYKVLSIDAWAEDEASWTWNTWFYAGSIDLDINNPEKDILKAMYEAGYITQTEGGDVEDDQYNLVIVDKTTREPLFAIEYGSTI